MELFLFICLAGIFIFMVMNRLRIIDVERRLAELRAAWQQEVKQLAALKRQLDSLASGIAPIAPETKPHAQPHAASVPEPPAGMRQKATPQMPVPPSPEQRAAQSAGPADIISPTILPPAVPPSPPVSIHPPLALHAPIPRQKLSIDWESLVGVKLFSWIAAIALALAAIFFLRYSIDQGWLVPKVRMAVGVVAGIMLLALCELKAARRYPVTANALDGAAIAILFSTFFAAHQLWNLTGIAVTFVLLVCVTALAVSLSIRRDSLFIALLGLLGGFATPALLSTGEDHPIPLFTYLILLNAGLSAVAFKKKWQILTLLSVILTTIYQWGWVIKFLRAGNLSLAAGIFLIFPVLSFIALGIGSKGEEKTPPLFGRTANLSALLPLFFALYLPSIPAYGEHYVILFGFLLCLDLGLLVITLVQGTEILHFAGGLSTILVFAVWLNVSYRSSAWPGIIGFLASFFILYLIAPHIARFLAKGFTGMGAKAIFAAPLLLSAFPLLARIEPRCAEPAILFLTLFFLAGLAAANSIISGNFTVHLATSTFVILTETVWSWTYLSRASLNAALAIYGIFGLFFIAVPILSKWSNAQIRCASPDNPSINLTLYLGISSHLFLFSLLANPTLSLPPWPIFFVLACLNLAVGLGALHARRGDLHCTAIAVSYLAIIYWEAAAQVQPWPAIAVAAASVLALFAGLWLYLSRRLGSRGNSFGVAAVVAVALSQLVTVGAEMLDGIPALELLIVSHVAFAAALLFLSWNLRWHYLAILAAAHANLGTWVWQMRYSGTGYWREQLIFAASLYFVFLAYPLVLGKRAQRLLEPFLAAVLAGAAFFLQARLSLLAGGLGDVIGILPVMQALLTSVLLLQLLRLQPPGERSSGRLALVAGTVLAFVTVAIPLQLDKEWITVGWALEGIALAWLYLRISHRGLLWASNALLLAVFLRLAANIEVFTYYPRTWRIFNWYLYAYLIAAGAHFLAARFFSRSDDTIAREFPRPSSLLPAGGTILLFLLLNIEIADFYSTGSTITFNFSATLAQDLTYTLGWAIFALGLLGAGIFLRRRPARIAAIALLVATILKCFLHDLARLGGLYRIGSFVGLAICLAIVAVMLQRFVLTPRKEAP